MEPKSQVLEVWGDLACFSRPEFKVERFSYPIITPSAARGIFDAIFCKPNKNPSRAQFRWQITRIELLSPISYIALRRNETGAIASVANIKRWMKGTSEVRPLKIVQAQQRQTMALKHVHYRITAEIITFPNHSHKQQALEAQFIRRATKGKCYFQPYFGCREFPAYFHYIPIEVLGKQKEPINHNQDFSMMLYDVFDLSVPNTSSSEPYISIFHAKMEKGVLNIPPFESKDVIKPNNKKEGN